MPTGTLFCCPVLQSVHILVTHTVKSLAELHGPMQKHSHAPPATTCCPGTISISPATACHHAALHAEIYLWKSIIELQKETKRCTGKIQFKKCASSPFTFTFHELSRHRVFLNKYSWQAKSHFFRDSFLIWSQEHTQGSCTLCINVLSAEIMLNSLHSLFSKLCLQ